MTCDNATNNDVMIQELETLTPEFAGFASHTRCFLHIVNLVAKALLRQFDAKKTTVKRDNELAAWADELAKEEVMVDEIDDDDRDDDDDSDNKKVDNEDGLVDEMDDKTNDEWINLEDSIRPVKLALAKVSQTFTDTPLT